MKTTTTKTTPFLIRRVIVAAREGVMQCPRCSYLLSESDALLCRVGETHYCPHCWSKIPNSTETVLHPDGDPHDATSDASRTSSSSDALPEDDNAKQDSSDRD